MRMGPEEGDGDHAAAVSDAEQKGLRPIPRSVEADRPPERASAPQGKAEDEADEARGEEAERTLAGVARVAQAEDEGEKRRGDPEADGSRVFRRGEDTYGSGDPTGHREEEITARAGLFEEGDEEKGEEPLGSEAKDGDAGELAAGEDEEMSEREGGDEEGEQHCSPRKSARELGEGAWREAEAVGAQGTALDTRQEKSGDCDAEGGDAFVERACAELESTRCGAVGGGTREEELASIQAAEGQQKAEDGEEKKDAPACTEAVRAKEDVAGEAGWVRSGDFGFFGGCR